MDRFEDIRNQAKTDSRRFAKRIVCRIVYDKLLNIMYDEGMVPSGIFINYKTGLDPINGKMFVIPAINYSKVQSLVKNYQPTISEDDLQERDIESIETVTRSKSALIDSLRQNAILVTISLQMPEGKLAGLSPEWHDVIIDSTDVNQSIEGTYVYRSKQNVRNQPKIND
jgi:hypothetical protein